MLSKLIERFRAVVQDRGGTTLEEKRQLIRLRCSFRINCVTKSRSLLGTVTDMSLRGMRLEVPGRVAAGSTVRVVYVSPSHRFEVDVVQCRVHWCRKHGEEYTVGVVYEEEPARMARSWVKGILRHLGFDDEKIYQRRRTVRADAAVLPGRVTLNPGEEFEGGVDVRILNLGVGGALVQSKWKMELGTPARLRIGTGDRSALDVPAIVRTRRFERVTESYLTGLRFEELEPSEVGRLGGLIIDMLRSAAAPARAGG